VGVRPPGVMHPVRDGFGRQRKQQRLSDGVATTVAAQRFPKAPACPDYSAVNCPATLAVSDSLLSYLEWEAFETPAGSV
jgi:hypothetical protein